VQQPQLAHRHTRLRQPVAALVALPDALGLARVDGAAIGVEGNRIDRRRQTKRPRDQVIFCACSPRSFLLSSMRAISARICSMQLPPFAEMAAVSSSRVRACVRRSCASCASLAPARSSSRAQLAIRLSSSSPLRWANQGRSASRQRRSASTCYTSAACRLQSAVSGCGHHIKAFSLATWTVEPEYLRERDRLLIVIVTEFVEQYRIATVIAQRDSARSCRYRRART
jgi:hypothetical protein